MRLLIETNAGTYLVALNNKGEVCIFEGEDPVPVAVIDPLTKRKAVMDLSTDGIASAACTWLETHDEHLEINCITAHIAKNSH